MEPVASKRKRSPGPTLLPRPTLDTTLASHTRPLPVDRLAAEMAETQGSESPRTAVASKFKELGLMGTITFPTLDKSADEDVFEDVAMDDPDNDKEDNDGDDDEARKRRKLQQVALNEDADNRRAALEEALDQVYPGSPTRSAAVATAKHKSTPTKAASRSKGPKIASPKKPLKRLKSPPLSASDSRSDSSSASPNLEETNPFTWQDWEITGHLAQDPDDDGHGINGIGFRPTPQTAEARLQKRRKQIADWKSREAREQRQRRSERRYGETKADADLEQGVNRLVRFA